ncbi:serine hydrolase [bacterium]|nr:serine hydrolase [bacterium]MBP9807104.1 serine hydrolase [bacterium]
MTFKAFTTAALMSLLVGSSVSSGCASPASAEVTSGSDSMEGQSVSKVEPLKVSLKNCQAAAAYSAKARGFSMLVIEDGKIIFEDYPNGHSAAEPHELASGTKSFTGLCALAASEDGILSLDEKVSDTISEWQGDPKRENITIRELLSLTSGITSATGMAPPYAQALQAEITAKPGEKFQYGPAPFQVFGELMVRKLKAKNNTKGTDSTMVDYLKRRVLNLADIHVGLWRKGRDGMPLMPQGAALTAREWAKVGELVLNGGIAGGKQIIQSENVKTLFVGTAANPMYGLSWWLNRPMDAKLRSSIRTLTMASDLHYGAPGVPNDLVMAAGAGKQRLYVIPSMKLVVVRQADVKSELIPGADNTRFSDVTFWQLLTRGHADSEGASNRPRALPGLRRSGSMQGRQGGSAQSGVGQGGAGQGGRFMRLLDRNHDGVVDQKEKQVFRNFLQRKQKASSSEQ